MTCIQVSEVSVLEISFFWHLLLQPCVIADCGEHKDGDNWGTAPNDGSGDALPDYPEDSDISLKDVSICEVFDLQRYFRPLHESHDPGWTT